MNKDQKLQKSVLASFGLRLVGVLAAALIFLAASNALGAAPANLSADAAPVCVAQLAAATPWLQVLCYGLGILSSLVIFYRWLKADGIDTAKATRSVVTFLFGAVVLTLGFVWSVAALVCIAACIQTCGLQPLLLTSAALGVLAVMLVVYLYALLRIVRSLTGVIARDQQGPLQPSDRPDGA